MKLWGSRMFKPTNRGFHQLNASLAFDMRLYREDIDGSTAWGRSLAAIDILTQDEFEKLIGGLEQIRSEFEDGTFKPAPSDEDIHTAVERRLGEIIGATAGKLHTGRSRNDQVATDFRLWIMRACTQLDQAIKQMQEAILVSAGGALTTPMPGYTHLQGAQPVTWGHWMLSHFWSLSRDRGRFRQVRATAAILPLGSGALAGTPFPVDRQNLAQDLGFTAISPNSIDAVADRDFALEFLFAAATLGVHLSRMAEALILFSSAEFGFIELDDAYATGSSLMPQKKNPDALELARGKAGRLIGHLTGLLATIKGLPSAYDKDLQEDKEPVFDAFDTLDLLLPTLAGLVQTLRLKPKRMVEAITPSMLATDLADSLVRTGIPFRQAHDLVGRAVRMAEEKGVPLTDLSYEELRTISGAFPEDIQSVFNVGAALERRSSVGGVAASSLQEQLEAAHKALA
jgi:argininosuccinate lyase